MSTTMKAHEARRELQSYRGKRPARPMGEPEDSWYVKYVGAVVDFMCAELSDAQLSAWGDVFTALYELTGAGLYHFLRPEVRTEDQAWARVDPWVHIVRARLFTLNPTSTDPLDFVGEYCAFIAYMGREGIIGKAVHDSLAARFAELAADAARQAA